MMLTFLKIVPKNLLSRFVGCLADTRISKPFIPGFAKRYKISLEEAGKPIEEYPTLNAFFTRHLKPGKRPIAGEGDAKAVVSPVDGAVAQCGPIRDGKLVQAKGREYTLEGLLGDKDEAARFQRGWFMTVYLAPTDYHRMHHYADGKVTGYRYLPGYLWPVNLKSVEGVDQLFCVNERLTSYLDHAGTPSAIVKVGATIVGKIRCTHTPTESNCGEAMKAETYAQPVPVRKGDELGLFAMGSTVVMLFPRDAFLPEPVCEPGQRLKVGQLIGRLS